MIVWPGMKRESALGVVVAERAADGEERSEQACVVERVPREYHECRVTVPPGCEQAQAPHAGGLIRV